MQSYTIIDLIKLQGAAESPIRLFAMVQAQK